MSDTVTFEIPIPTDNDGYILLQCQHCGEFFKCTPNDLKSDEVLHIFCPSCGLISANYLTEDVRQLATAMATNYMQEQTYNAFKEMERHTSSSMLKIKTGQKPQKEYEPPIHSSINDLQITNFDCCNRSAKINPLLKMSASHCPFCGGVRFENN